MSVASGIDRPGFFGREFIGRPVSAGFLHEGERAIIDDQVIFEKGFGSLKGVFKKAPKAFSADFAALACEAFHLTFRMFVGRFSDRFVDLQPVAYGFDFAKWDSGLHHAPRTWIHSEKKDPFVARRKSA